MTDRSERNLTEILEATVQAHHARIVGMAAAEGQAIPPWEQLEPYAKHVMKDQLLPVVMDVLSVVDAEPHKAKRSDEVDAYIKKYRDFWREGHGSPASVAIGSALNDLLDDYRAHADYGLPLHERVPEPPEAEAFFEAALSATRDPSEILGPPDIKAMIDAPDPDTFGAAGYMVEGRSERVQMHEYVHNPESGSAGPYEADIKYQFVDQTPVWAVHFNCPRAALPDALERMSELTTTTGEYLYEEAGTLSDHSAEPTDDDHRLVIYYIADRERAYDEGWHIVVHAHFASKEPNEPTGRTGIDFYVSTAGDHSAQIEWKH